MLALRTLIMAMIALTGLIGAGLIGPNRSAIEAEYGLSHSQFGTGIAVIQIFVATAVLLTANRLKRFASLKVLMVGLALQALAFSAIYFTRSVWAMALSWAMIILALKLAAVSNHIAPGYPLDEELQVPTHQEPCRHHTDSFRHGHPVRLWVETRSTDDLLPTLHE